MLRFVSLLLLASLSLGDQDDILQVISSSYADTLITHGNSDNAIERPELLHYDPDVELPTPELVRRAGYYSEAHVVETEDGYLLTLHRIPGRLESPVTGEKPSVILQHGLLASSADWVIPGQGKALAYILADQGYDVWLGNARGNTYSRAHVRWSKSDSKFWNFTWHEMGIYDLPAIIGYITAYKQEETLLYVGHSMGTTMFYVMASERPEVASKVRAMFSLAPVAFMNHVKTPIRIVAPYADDIALIAHFLGADEFLPQGIILRFLAKYGCDIDVTEEKICANSLFVLCGFDKYQFNNTLLPVILGHTPAGASTKSLIHYAQEIMSGKFRQYDYGIVKNQEIYNTSSPPEYDLSKISVPIAVHYADNDWLASVTDVGRLYEALPNKLGKFRVNFPNFNHLDFLWGIDAPKLVYRQMLTLMEKYRYEGRKKRYSIPPRFRTYRVSRIGSSPATSHFHVYTKQYNLQIQCDVVRLA